MALRLKFQYKFQKIPVLLAAACCLLGTPLHTEEKTTAFMPTATRELTLVPAGDTLYLDLEKVRSAGWSTLPVADAPQLLTRYEMALEVAKAVIVVRAHARADARWASTATPESLRSLRALCVALQEELARFDGASKSILPFLDTLLKNSEFPARPMAASNVALAPTRNIPGANLDAFDAGAPSEYSMTALPLSQRLRVYGAVSTLARAQTDDIARGARQENLSFKNLQFEGARSVSSAGVLLSINDWIRVRGGVTERPAAMSLSQALADGASTLPAGANSFGGGMDIALRPGVVLSGDVSRLNTATATSFFGLDNPYQPNRSITKFEGGLGVSGWQNRFALSAHLSRLVPEDSLALATTAAQFNLGFDLTQQISLKLLYQQLFDAPQTGRSNRVIAGGININF